VPDSTPGKLIGLPIEVPLVYAALSSFLVGVFGLAYGWLALQPDIDRPMVALAALAKTGVFFIALALWAFDHVAGPLMLVAIGDLLFAMLWFLWLFQNPLRFRSS